jgi:transcriptional regulator with XRE-family HTH domain
METLGDKILEIRKRKGLTQEELSDLAKINLRTLQRIEKGETVPRGNTLKMLCGVLEINMEDILDYGKTEDNKYIRYFHLSVLTFIFIPLGNIIIPLILWITKRDKIIGLNEQGADLLNFQILWTLLFSGLMVTGITLYFDNAVAGTPPYSDSFPPLFIIGGILYILNIIYPIVVSILTGKGSLKRYYYPLIRFVRL